MKKAANVSVASDSENPKANPKLIPIDAQALETSNNINIARATDLGDERHKALTFEGTNAQPTTSWTLNNFHIVRLLGSGSFANVYLAKQKHNSIVALKVIVRGANRKQLDAEINIHSNVHHENIIRMYGYFWEKSCVHLVLENAPQGSLRQKLLQQRNHAIPESLAAKYIYQLADALLYCHERKIIHRDIKPDNLLLDCKGRLKLSDFGLAVCASTCHQTRKCGSCPYMSPEMVNEEPYNMCIDLWSVGVLAYEFITGKIPFNGRNRDELFQRITQVDYKIPRYITNDAKEVINSLLQLNPNCRLPLKILKRTAWMRTHVKLC